MKAIWNGKVIADSKDIINLENNSYFPESSVRKEFLKKSNTTSRCPWKGLANYYTIEVDGIENRDAAWYYPNPSEAAKEIKDHVAFWKGVKVVDD